MASLASRLLPTLPCKLLISHSLARRTVTFRGLYGPQEQEARGRAGPAASDAGLCPPPPIPYPLSDWGALVPRACSDLDSVLLFCPWSHLSPVLFLLEALSVTSAPSLSLSAVVITEFLHPAPLPILGSPGPAGHSKPPCFGVPSVTAGDNREGAGLPPSHPLQEDGAAPLPSISGPFCFYVYFLKTR